MVSVFSPSSQRFHEMESEAAHDTPTQAYSQYTDYRVRKATFVPTDPQLILVLGYGAGRGMHLWRRDVEGVEPFEALTSLGTDTDPMDLQFLNNESFVVAGNDGSVTVCNQIGSDITKAKQWEHIHGHGDVRVLSTVDNVVYSGSSNGTIVRIDAETGARQQFKGSFAGVRSLCAVSGGSLLASGHSSGQLLIWDLRIGAAPVNAPLTTTPSKRNLDAVTALTCHPAQANLISMGTDNGSVGFCDIRGNELLPSMFDLASATITQVAFHPESGDHLVCGSADGSVVHWDASGVAASAYLQRSAERECAWLSGRLEGAVSLRPLRARSSGAVSSIAVADERVLVAVDLHSFVLYQSVRFTGASSYLQLRQWMTILTKVDWGHYVPPVTARSLLAHYLPISGACSHALFAVHVFNPQIVSQLFPVGDLAVSNSILFNANLGLGFYVYFRHHMHRLNSWDRVEFSVFATTMFNFGSLLAAVVTKALIPKQVPTWGRSLLAVSLSLYLMTRARKYLHYVDQRSARGSPSPRPSPMSNSKRSEYITNGTNGNSLHTE